MIHRFGVFEFESDSGELRKNGRVVALEPQPAKALALLLSTPGEIVSREALRDAVWGADTHVDFDRGIAYCLSQIRTALGDSGDNPRFVQTIPKRGIKFIAPIAGATGATGATSAAGATGATAPPHWAVMGLLVVAVIGGLLWLVLPVSPSRDRVVIAVSVFDNETGTADFDRPVAALSDLVVERLTKVEPTRVAVIGNAAALRQPRNIRNLKALAASIKADYVILGQLQRGEGGLRFITHFIRVRDEAHLKANRLDVVDETLAGLEAAVVEEFERAVRAHALTAPPN